MTIEEKEQLSNFEARLRHMFYMYDELKQRNVELKKLLENEIQEKAELQSQFNRLESNYKSLKTATTININSGDVKETKLRIDSLVREIDKCIAQLNE